jgi:hypothetical protein
MGAVECATFLSRPRIQGRAYGKYAIRAGDNTSGLIKTQAADDAKVVLEAAK